MNGLDEAVEGARQARLRYDKQVELQMVNAVFQQELYVLRQLEEVVENDNVARSQDRSQVF